MFTGIVGADGSHVHVHIESNASFVTHAPRPTEIRERALAPGERVVEFSPAQIAGPDAGEILSYVFVTDRRIVWVGLDAIAEERPDAVGAAERESITRVERSGMQLRVEMPGRSLCCRFPRAQVANAFYRHLAPRPAPPEPPPPHA